MNVYGKSIKAPQAKLFVIGLILTQKTALKCEKRLSAVFGKTENGLTEKYEDGDLPPPSENPPIKEHFCSKIPRLKEHFQLPNSPFKEHFSKTDPLRSIV